MRNDTKTPFSTGLSLYLLSGFSCPFPLLLVGNSQFPAAFVSPPFKHVAAIFGFHPGAKTVCFGAFALFRLKCAFWHIFMKNEIKMEVRKL